MMRKILLISLLLAISPTHATTLLGVGNTSCLQFLTDSKTKRNFVDTQTGIMYYSWTQGFITAMNDVMDADVGKNKSPDRLLNWLIDYCEANRLDNYYKANKAYYEEKVGSN